MKLLAFILLSTLSLTCFADEKWEIHCRGNTNLEGHLSIVKGSIYSHPHQDPLSADMYLGEIEVTFLDKARKEIYKEVLTADGVMFQEGLFLLQLYKLPYSGRSFGLQFWKQNPSECSVEMYLQH